MSLLDIFKRKQERPVELQKHKEENARLRAELSTLETRLTQLKAETLIATKKLNVHRHTVEQRTKAILGEMGFYERMD